MSEPARSARGGRRRRAAWGRVGAAVALACLCATTHAQQIPSKDEGYYVETTKDEFRTAEGDDVGWQQVINFKGTPGTPDTAGSSFEGSIIFGVTARNCPTVDGIVTGKGTWRVTYDRHVLQPDGMNNSLLSLEVVVNYTGHVGEDARLGSVDAETIYDRKSTGGIRTSRGPLLSVPATPTHQTFKSSYTVKNGTFGDIGFSELDPMKAHLGEAASITAILGYHAEQVFKQAELNWLKENNCVEMEFDPATSTTRVAPGESIRVKAELKTKKTPTTVGANFKEAGPNAGGSVTPKQGRSGVGAPLPFTYTAPQDKDNNKGFWAGAVSRAGVARGEWAPLGLGLFKFEGLSFVCDIPVPGTKEVLHTERQLKGDSCGDLRSWTIRPTNVTRGPGGRGVQPDKAFETSCEPTGGPNAESQIRARRARPAGAGGWVCTYAVGADGAVTLTFFNFKSSFCQGAKEETFTVTAQPTDKCGEQPPPPPPPKRETPPPPPPKIPVLPPL